MFILKIFPGQMCSFFGVLFVRVFALVLLEVFVLLYTVCKGIATEGTGLGMCVTFSPRLSRDCIVLTAVSDVRLYGHTFEILGEVVLLQDYKSIY